MTILEPVSAAIRLQIVDGDELSLAVRRFELVERIDHPFEMVAELVTDDLQLEVRSMLGARAHCELDRPGVTARGFGGLVTRAEYITTRSQQLTVRVVVEPSLALLRYSTRRRIFADLSLSEILDAVTAPVFASHGGSWDFSRVSGAMLSRDYVVQYDETDLDFVLRLLGESGLCLLHGQAEEAGGVYVLVDSNAMLPGGGVDPAVQAESKPMEVSFVPTAEEESREPSVQYLGRWDGLSSPGATVQARDWKSPGATRFETLLELGDERGAMGHVWSYHPGRLEEGKGGEGVHHDATEGWATRLVEERRAGGVEVSGASNVVDFIAGATFQLDGHPHVDLDQDYAVLSVVHQGDFPEVEVEVGHAVGAATYTNRFVAAPIACGPVRPPLRPKPRVSGIESATVVGPDGEEVHTDALGRVRVRFHWDDAPSQTCWLRVMTSWAGPGYGASVVPRVGMEVVVGFLGGDPDRPVVTGCLYTGTNLPPGALPDTKTQTVFRTQSTPGGEGFNELRFEDAAGSEEVFMHAQRNQRTVVRAAQSTRVGASRSLSVGKDSTRTIGGNETVHIGGEGEEVGNLEVLVTGGESRTVHDGHELTADSALWRMATTLYADASDEVRVSCSETGSRVTLEPSTLTLEARESIQLKVGEASVLLSHRGVFIDGPVFTATPTEHAEVSAPGGSLTLRQEDAVLRGGSGEESSVSLSSQQLECKAKAKLRVEGAGVTVHGLETARFVSQETQVEGVTGLSMTCAGETVVRGSTVRIN